MLPWVSPHRDALGSPPRAFPFPLLCLGFAPMLGCWRLSGCFLPLSLCLVSPLRMRVLLRRPSSSASLPGPAPHCSSGISVQPPGCVRVTVCPTFPCISCSWGPSSLGDGGRDPRLSALGGTELVAPGGPSWLPCTAPVSLDGAWQAECGPVAFTVWLAQQRGSSGELDSPGSFISSLLPPCGLEGGRDPGQGCEGLPSNAC